MGTPINPPQIPSLTVAGRVFTDLVNLKQLRFSTASGGNFSATARLPSASSGYQVPVGKTFKVVAVQYFIESAAAAGGSKTVAIAQSDNDVGLNSATALSNAVYPGGALGNAFLNAISTLQNNWEAVVDFSVAASKYISVENTTGAGLKGWIFGYEV